VRHALRQADAVLLFAAGPDGKRRQWQSTVLPEVQGHAKLQIQVLPESLFTGLAGELARRIRWQLTVSGGTLYVTQGERTLEAAIESW